MSDLSKEELLEIRERVAFSPSRTARVDRELKRLGYADDDEKKAKRGASTRSKAVNQRETTKG